METSSIGQGIYEEESHKIIIKSCAEELIASPAIKHHGRAVECTLIVPSLEFQKAIAVQDGGLEYVLIQRKRLAKLLGDLHLDSCFVYILCVRIFLKSRQKISTTLILNTFQTIYLILLRGAIYMAATQNLLLLLILRNLSREELHPIGSGKSL